MLVASARPLGRLCLDAGVVVPGLDHTPRPGTSLSCCTLPTMVLLLTAAVRVPLPACRAAWMVRYCTKSEAGAGSGSMSVTPEELLTTSEALLVEFTALLEAARELEHDRTALLGRLKTLNVRLEALEALCRVVREQT